jgi:hypothetical protein
LPLNAKERKRVDEAIKRGIDFLRSVQLPNGSFGNGLPAGARAWEGGRWWPVGFAAFPALALLECGVPPDDPAIEKAARLVRENLPKLNRTYEISLALLFLDRLGKPEDRLVIRSLALRLAAGQTSLGGWGYQCPILTPAQQMKVLEDLRKQKPQENSKLFLLSNLKKARPETADNSNTQFAILALWVARRHDLPLDYSLAQVERRFRSGQIPGGWDYRLRATQAGGYGSMTCAGLLGLAVGRGSAAENVASRTGSEPEKVGDRGIAAGLLALGRHMSDPTDHVSLAAASDLGPKGKLNLYFLWSVERVGVLLNLKTIGGKDWYRWGADLLIRTQNGDGSWTGRGNGGSAPVIDTSMALLFLKRSDLLPDLRETLQKRLKITDPGLDKAISPGEKSKPKSGTKSPGEKSDNSEKKPDLKRGIPKKETEEQTRPQSKGTTSHLHGESIPNGVVTMATKTTTDQSWSNPANWMDTEGKHWVPETIGHVTFPEKQTGSKDREGPKEACVERHKRRKR